MYVISQHTRKQLVIKVRRKRSAVVPCFSVFFYPVELLTSLTAKSKTAPHKGKKKRKASSNRYCLHLTKNNLRGLVLLSEEQSAHSAERDCEKKTQSSTFFFRSKLEKKKSKNVATQSSLVLEVEFEHAVVSNTLQPN